MNITVNTQFGTLTLRQIGTSHSYPVLTLENAISQNEGLVGILAGMFASTNAAMAVNDGNISCIITGGTAANAAIEREALTIERGLLSAKTTSINYTRDFALLTDNERAIDRSLIYSYKYSMDEVVNSVSIKPIIMALGRVMKCMEQGVTVSDDMYEEFADEAMELLSVYSRTKDIESMMS